MGPSRSSSLRIDGDSPPVPISGRTRGAPDRSAVAEHQTAVTPCPDEVHSICNCRGTYVHQVPL